MRPWMGLVATALSLAMWTATVVTDMPWLVLPAIASSCLALEIIERASRAGR